MTKGQESGSNKRLGRVSHGFKITVVILFILFSALRLLLIQLYPTTEIIPDKFFLFIAIFIMIYLWVQDLKDFHNLQIINKDLEESHEQLKQAEIDTIASLIEIEEAKDQYTKGHSERVTKYAMAIAEEMHLGDGSKKIISRAGLLHDIGKIGISDDILHKKEQLTEEEWQVIRNHPETGFKVLLPFKFLSYEREIIISHHERYDGKGYPRGLKGENIHLEAMILAVADAFDAMNTKRSYRDPLSKDAIIEELVKSRGGQHSAKVIDAFLTLLNNHPEIWKA